MSDKLKNLIVRAVTGVFFVTVMVLGILHPHALIALFALITGLSIWEYTGLVNNIKGVKVNRFISTIAGVYFFLSVAGLRLTPVEGFRYLCTLHSDNSLPVGFRAVSEE